MGEAFIFVENSAGPERYSAIFEATAGDQEGTPAGGYLYICDSSSAAVIRSLEIYKHAAYEIRDNDVQIFWSSNLTKCGVSIWGRMRGIIDIVNNRETAALLDNSANPAITDAGWLEGFENYLDREQFIRARQRFWKEKARVREPGINFPPEIDTPVETELVVYEKGPAGLFGVFEDDGDTGYLYILDVTEQKIVQRLQIYDNARRLSIGPEDVEVVWSEDRSKCGVLIWNKMRGIIDLTAKREGRVKLENRETPGIGDNGWLSGFSLD